MKHLGEFEGEGELFANGKSVGHVRYHINAWESERRRTANGDMWGDDQALFTAATARETKLVLADGRAVVIVLDNFSGGQGHADISVSGPIPGL